MATDILLAQVSDDTARLLFTLMPLALFLFTLIVFLLIVKSMYKKCRSNELLVVYGAAVNKNGDSFRVQHGGGTFVLPFIQDCRYISLEPIHVPLEVRGALSRDRTRINLTGEVVVAVGSDPVTAQNAASRLLDFVPIQIRKLAEEIVASSCRRVIASMGSVDIRDDYGPLETRLHSDVDSELRKTGLVLININLNKAIEPASS